jgi:hypothetical protein
MVCAPSAARVSSSHLDRAFFVVASSERKEEMADGAQMITAGAVSNRPSGLTETKEDRPTPHRGRRKAFA